MLDEQVLVHKFGYYAPQLCWINTLLVPWFLVDLDACAFVPGISETMVDIGTEMVQGLIGTASQAQARIRQPTA